MATTAMPTQAKTALVAICGLIFLKLGLLRTAVAAGPKAFVITRGLLVTPATLTVSLLVFTWVCWATWRTSRADNDIRGVLQLLIGFDVLLYLLVFLAEHLA